jgi:hypothetical protein
MRAARIAAWLSLGAFTLALSLQKIRSLDYWMHLRTGRLIWEGAAVPSVDPYSYTLPGTPWVDVYWLFQLGLHGLHALGGHEAVVLGKALLALLLVVLLGRIGYRPERAALSVAALALCLLVVGDRIMPRPELPTFVLLAATLLLFDRFERRGDAWIFAWPLLQLLWVNLHGLFVLGFAVAGAHAADELARPVLGRGPLRPRRLGRLGAALALALLACVINPNGLDTALLPLQQLSMIGSPEQREALALQAVETASLLRNWRALSPLLLAAFGLLVLLSGAAMAFGRRRLRPSDPLLWSLFLLLALLAIRNMALFALVAAPLLVRNTNAWLDARGARLPGADALAALLAVAVALLAWDAARGDLFRRLGSPREPGLGVLDVLHPVGAAEWIAANRPPGPLGHHMADGGYLIWRLYPDYLVLADGRWIYRARPEVVRLLGEKSFRRLDAELHFGTVIVHYSPLDLGPLLRALYRDREWQLVFADEVAAVFVRRRAGQTQPDLDVSAPDFFGPLPEEEGYADFVRRLGRVRFWFALGRPRRAQAELAEARRRHPRSFSGP